MILMYLNKIIPLFVLIFICPLIYLTQCSAKTIPVKDKKEITSKKIIQDSVVTEINDTVLINPENSKISLVVVKEKSNEDYWKYIIPILTLLLGIAINKGLDWLSDRKKTKKAGKRWVAEIRSLENPINTEIGYLEAFLVEHNKETFITPQLPILSILNCEVFKSLDKSELLNYIELNRKKTHQDAVHTSNRTNGFISILTNLYEQLIEKFNKYLTETSKHSVSFSRNLQAFMREFAYYGVSLEQELGGDPMQNENYKAIADLITEYITPHTEDGKYALFELEQEFFIPMLPILANLRFDERSKPLALAVSGCLNEIKGVKMEKGYFRENVETIISRYKKQSGEVKKIVEGIEGTS